MAEREVNPEVIEQERLANELGKSFLEILKEQARERGRFNQETKQTTDLAKELSKFTRDDLKSSRKRAKFQQKLQDAKAEQKSLEAKILKQQEELADLSGQELKDGELRLKQLQQALETSKETVEEAKLLAKEYKLLDTISAGFDVFGNAVNDIPVIREAFKEFGNASKEIADSFRAGEGPAKAFAAGVTEFGKGLGKASIIGLITQFFLGTKKAEDFSRALVRGFQLPRVEAEIFREEVEDISKRLGEFSPTEVTQALVDISNNLGFATLQSEQFTRTFLTLTQRLGLSADAALDIAKFAAASGKSFRGVSNDIQEITEGLNRTNDLNIRFGDILNDVATASEATLLTTQKFPGGLAKAAFEARKFGMSLSQLESTSESLLNFQSSIESELEAELLTGRRLNLEQARMAALMGDQSKLAAEVAKNVGSIEEFQGMNVIQQEALAKAFGMTRQELAKTLIDRKSLVELEKTSRINGLADLSRQEQIAKLTKKYEKDGLSATEARSKALRNLGEDELDRQERALTFQQEISNSFEELQLAISNLGKVFGGDLLKSLVESIQSLTELITLIGQEGFMGGIKKFVQDQLNERNAEIEAKREIVSDEKEITVDGQTYRTGKNAEGNIITRLDQLDLNNPQSAQNSEALIKEIQGLRNDLNTGKLKLMMDGRAVGETIALNYTAIG